MRLQTSKTVAVKFAMFPSYGAVAGVGSIVPRSQVTMGKTVIHNVHYTNKGDSNRADQLGPGGSKPGYLVRISRTA
jgi:hypothetical protein